VAPSAGGRNWTQPCRRGGRPPLDDHLVALILRQVRLAGVTRRPNGPWVVQQAGELSMERPQGMTTPWFLIRDRDSKFTRVFDDVFASDGTRVIMTPVQAPNANAFAERWIRTVRVECLDWLLIVGREHLERVLTVYVDHYNEHRPHRALGLRPPNPLAPVMLLNTDQRDHIHRRDLLGGLLHEYQQGA
jgi:putative transposase